jgi:aminomethyltransferase
MKPCGLAARDTLRLEAAMPLFGHELNENMNALAVGMNFAINLDKSIENDGETFIGQEALVKIRDNGGPEQKLVGIVLDTKRTARQGMEVLVDGKPVGCVTSGCMSPTLEKSIAMAYIRAENCDAGTKIQVDAGRHQFDGEVVALPFYKAPK